MRLLTGAVKLTFFDAMRSQADGPVVGGDRKNWIQDCSRPPAPGSTPVRSIKIEFNLAKVRYGQSQRALILAQENYRLPALELRTFVGRLSRR